MTLSSVLPRASLALSILAAALCVGLNRGQLDPSTVESALRSLGPWGAAAHVALFALGTVLFVPGALFGLAGGVLLGPVWGTIANLAGATLGATAAFLVARYVAADLVRQKAGARLDRLIKGVEAEGWRFVAFMRLVPLIPFNLLNYALGLTRIPLAAYALASLVCMLPGALAYAWLGYAGREALAGSDAAIRYGMMGAAALAAVGFLPRLLRRVKRADGVRWVEPVDLAAQVDNSDAVTVIDVRGPDEFTGPLGHIPGARNLPLGELPHRVRELGSPAETPIVLVCHTDRRSARAATLLGDAGFPHVTVLRGGMVRWNEAGLPVAHRHRWPGS